MVELTVAVDPGRLGDVVGHLSRAELDEVDRAPARVLDLA
jgi:mRNA interferase MazF